LGWRPAAPGVGRAGARTRGGVEPAAPKEGRRLGLGRGGASGAQGEGGGG
jgi:hypothetical protein